MNKEEKEMLHGILSRLIELVPNDYQGSRATLEQELKQWFMISTMEEYTKSTKPPNINPGIPKPPIPSGGSGVNKNPERMSGPTPIPLNIFRNKESLLTDYELESRCADCKVVIMKGPEGRLCNRCNLAK